MNESAGHLDLSTLAPNYRASLATRWRNIVSARCFWKPCHVRGLSLHGKHVAAAGETRASIAGLVIAGFAIGGIIYTQRVSWLLSRNR